MFAGVAAQRNVTTIRHGTKRIFFNWNCAVAVVMLLPGATIVKENTPLTPYSPDIYFFEAAQRVLTSVEVYKWSRKRQIVHQ